MWLVWYVSNFVDEDLTPENVRKDKTIFWVEWTFEWGGILPSGWTSWILAINDILLYSSYETGWWLLPTYYYEDADIISWFAVFHTWHTMLSHYYPKCYLFNIDKLTWEITTSSVSWFDDASVPWYQNEYWIYEYGDTIYYITSWDYNTDKWIHIWKFDKITHTITEQYEHLSPWPFTWLEELSYLPVWYTTFTNPSPLPTDLYWSQFWNANFSWTWVWCRVPYITNT